MSTKIQSNKLLCDKSVDTTKVTESGNAKIVLDVRIISAGLKMHATGDTTRSPIGRFGQPGDFGPPLFPGFTNGSLCTH